MQLTTDRTDQKLMCGARRQHVKYCAGVGRDGRRRNMNKLEFQLATQQENTVHQLHLVSFWLSPLLPKSTFIAFSRRAFVLCRSDTL